MWIKDILSPLGSLYSRLIFRRIRKGGIEDEDGAGIWVPGIIDEIMRSMRSFVVCLICVG